MCNLYRKDSKNVILFSKYMNFNFLKFNANFNAGNLSPIDNIKDIDGSYCTCI